MLKGPVSREGIVEDDVYFFRKLVADYPRLTEEEERDLYKKLSEGDEEARDKLVLHNIGLAFALARKIKVRGTSFMDRLSEGYTALVNCSRSFNPVEASFSSYVARSIKNAIRKTPRVRDDFLNRDSSLQYGVLFDYLVECQASAKEPDFGTMRRVLSEGGCNERISDRKLVSLIEHHQSRIGSVSESTAEKESDFDLLYKNIPDIEDALFHDDIPERWREAFTRRYSLVSSWKVKDIGNSCLKVTNVRASQIIKSAGKKIGELLAA